MDAESEVQTGLVQTVAANLEDSELSRTPKFLPMTEIMVAPKTGPLVMAMEEAVGASKPNAIVLEPICEPTETVIEPDRARPEETLTDIVDEENHLDASWAETAKVEEADES